MATFPLYSKRQKIIRGEVPDIYIYDELPQELKVQIVHIIRDAIGHNRDQENHASNVYKAIRDTLCREYGVFKLNKSSYYSSEVIDYFLSPLDIEKSLDLIELCFKLIDGYIRNDFTYNRCVVIEQKPDDAIKELNDRFKEHGIGYQFESNEIIKLDSTYTHSEIVKPTINLLHNKKFSGANDEYLKAHEHYRHGRNKECITECLKSFESVLKIICQENDWAFDPKDTSKKLIDICINNKLIPQYIQNQFTSLRNLLESGISTIRNRLSAHGQGQDTIVVDDEIVRYTLNLTGTNIILLIELSGIK